MKNLNPASVVVASGVDEDRQPVLVIGLHPDAIKFMQETKRTHTVDGRRIGFNGQIIMFWDESQEAGIKTIQKLAGGKFTGKEYGIK